VKAYRCRELFDLLMASIVLLNGSHSYAFINRKFRCVHGGLNGMKYYKPVTILNVHIHCNGAFSNESEAKCEMLLISRYHGRGSFQ
jgi:hypothetical protein